MSDDKPRRFTLPNVAAIDHGGIDDEHGAILRHLNGLLSAIACGESAAMLAVRAFDFENMLRDHFTHEEEEMGKSSYPHLAAHAWLHANILVRVGEALRPLREGHAVRLDDVESLFGMLIDDVMRGDLDFKTHVEEYGIAAG